MTKLDQKLKADVNLLITFFISWLASVSFISFFAVLLEMGDNITFNVGFVTILTILCVFEFLLISFSSLQLYLAKNIVGDDLQERAKFTYLWAIFAGFIIFVPFLIYRSYYLSGGKVATVERAKKDYEIKVLGNLEDIDLLKAKIVSQNDPLLTKRFNDVTSLYENQVISSSERDTYIWELLKEARISIDQFVDYDNDKTILEVQEIIETY